MAGVSEKPVSLWISVQCVAPLLVSTNMTFNCRVNSLVKSASDFAREALNTVGYTNYTNGCVSHGLQVSGIGVSGDVSTPLLRNTVTSLP